MNTSESFVYDMCHGLAKAHPELEFVEKYKVITISQCEKMFYKNYELARSRLSALKKKGVLDSYKDERTARLVYFVKDKVSAPIFINPA